MQKHHLFSQNVAQKRIFVRADLNVPLAADGQIESDAKLLALLPTLNYLQSHNAAQVFVATHLGRPDAASPNPALSTKLLLPWFAAHGMPFTFCDDFANSPQAPLVLLENMRFFDGEHAHPSLTFAKQLADLADIFVIDAFGTLHRNDASVCLVPTFFTPENRLFGLCVATELEHLAVLHNAPKKPFIALLGGNKVADKLPLITHWIKTAAENRPSHILLGGLLGFELEKTAPELATQARAQNVILLTPSDYQYNTAGQPIDIGPATIQTFVGLLQTAQTIFANGTMGLYEEKEGEAGTLATLQAVAQSTGVKKIIGGGDCGAAVERFGLAQAMDFISTGGGATLAYLATEKPWQNLPGLKVLND